MKRRKFWHFLSMLLLISPLIGACVYSYPERHLSDFRADMTQPDQGAVIDLSETFVTGNVLHPGRELSRLVFYANGRNIGETSTLEAYPGDSRTSYGEINWTPPGVGEYLLQVEAETSPGPDVISEAVRVCVIDFEIDGGTFDSTSGYEGPCDITTIRDEFAVPGTITLEARATPASLRYNDFLQDPPCPEVDDAILSFEATVEDPPDDVVFVVVYYSMIYRADRTVTEALVLTQTRSAEPSTEIYTGRTINLSFALSSYFYGTGAGEITWTARAIGRSGEILREVGPYSIEAISSCGPVIPAIGPPPAATATLEPSELNCPPGTYYAPVTNKCISIEIKSPRPDRNCSQYGNSTSCSAAGCSWDGQSQACK